MWARFLASPLFSEEHDCYGVAALVFLEEALAVAAQLARIILSYGVGAVVAYYVVDSVA